MIMWFAYCTWALLVLALGVRLMRAKLAPHSGFSSRLLGLPLWGLVTAVMFLLSLPFVFGMNLWALLYGWFDLPSVLFVGLSLLMVLNPCVLVFRLAWFLGGAFSLLLVAAYLAGWVGWYESGYQPAFIVVFLGWFTFFLIGRSLAGLLVVCLAVLVSVFDLTQSGNGWHAVADAVWATAFVVSVIGAGVRKVVLALRGLRAHLQRN